MTRSSRKKASTSLILEVEMGTGLGRPASPEVEPTQPESPKVPQEQPAPKEEPVTSEEPEKELTPAEIAAQKKEKAEQARLSKRLRELTVEGRVPKEIIRILKQEGFKKGTSAADCMRIRRELSTEGLASKTCGSRGRPRVFRNKSDLDLLFSLLAQGLDHRTIAKELFERSKGHISVSPGTVSRSTHYYKTEFEAYLKEHKLEKPKKRGSKHGAETKSRRGRRPSIVADYNGDNDSTSSEFTNDNGFYTNSGNTANGGRGKQLTPSTTSAPPMNRANRYLQRRRSLAADNGIVVEVGRPSSIEESEVKLEEILEWEKGPHQRGFPVDPDVELPDHSRTVDHMNHLDLIDLDQDMELPTIGQILTATPKPERALPPPAGPVPQSVIPEALQETTPLIRATQILSESAAHRELEDLPDNPIEAIHNVVAPEIIAGGLRDGMPLNSDIQNVGVVRSVDDTMCKLQTMEAVDMSFQGALLEPILYKEKEMYTLPPKPNEKSNINQFIQKGDSFGKQSDSDIIAPTGSSDA